MSSAPSKSTSGLSSPSILIIKDRQLRQSNTESRRPKRSESGGLSSPGASPAQRVVFDKSIGPPPAPSNRMAGQTEYDIQKTYQASLRQRRTSLPLNPATTILNKLSSNVSEARGLVVDMLANRDLPHNVASCLRAVAALLTPQPPPINLHYDLGLPMVVENPFSGEKLIVSAASKPRVSNITFSTVTSATGLPTIAAEPSKARSSSYCKINERDGGQTTGDLSKECSLASSTANASTHSCKSSKELFVNAFSENEEKMGDHRSYRKTSELGQYSIETDDGTIFDIKELDRDRYLARIPEWGFPIFSFAESNRTTTLSKLTYSIFKYADLFRIFKLSMQKFFQFFHALERGYWDIPYHNRIHAADVLHGCFYLTCHPVSAFNVAPSTPEAAVQITQESPAPVSDSMSPLEIMALYTAATMHDYDHPGRTNAFLVAAEDKKAILYNDRSVLENHHAAESWRLLCKPEHTFIDTLDAAETKRFRYLVLEYILATDLKQHFDIIMQFNEKAAGMQLSNESDRVLIAQMLIKLADINSPSKPYPLHRQWTNRICEEFYEQGDEEKRRGMPVSPYMDRDQPAVAKLQDSFIAHIVNPLAFALNEVGLLPILPGLEEPEMIINLKHNHQKWLNVLDEQSALVEHIKEEKVTVDCNGPMPNETDATGDDSRKEDQFEMTTIEENGEDDEHYL